MDERCPDKTVIIKCASKTQENIRIHLFRAEQWKRILRHGSRNCCPRLSIRDDESWRNHYRARVDGKWHGGGAHKYCFYTKPEIMQIVSDLML